MTGISPKMADACARASLWRRDGQGGEKIDLKMQSREGGSLRGWERKVERSAGAAAWHEDL